MKNNTTILEIDGKKYELNTEKLIKLNLLNEVKKVESPKTVKKVVSPIVYNIGDVYKDEKTGAKFIFALVGVVNGKNINGLACLVGLSHGNRWVDPIEIVDINGATEEEWINIVGGAKFTKVNKPKL